jgi:hypothetical protein
MRILTRTCARVPVRTDWKILTLVVSGSLGLFPLASLGGTWTKITQAPADMHHIMLLSDGTVMAFHGCDLPFTGDICAGCNPCLSFSHECYRLAPDGQGSYINGTWTKLTDMNNSRLFFSSVVLKNGKVFVAGGEYGDGGATAEVYDPIANQWTLAPVPINLLDPSADSPNVMPVIKQSFLDSCSIILSDGRVLVTPVAGSTRGSSLIYDPTSNTWSAGPTLANNVAFQDEATWIKLPDESILTIDPFGTKTQRYIPGLNKWIPDTNTPVMLYSSAAFGTEIGPGLLLPDGRAFYMGATGSTAFYTPSGDTNLGSWVQGPDMPPGLVSADAPAAMMRNGKVFCALAPQYWDSGWPVGIMPGSPTFFFEFDPVNNLFIPVSAPDGTAWMNIATQKAKMVALPDGRVLCSFNRQELYVYTPTGAPDNSWKPTITKITQNVDGSYQLTGTQLNGLSQGASFGDDAQMDSNFPIVRLTDSDGNVSYARTYNWSSTGVMTGNRPVTTDFSLNAFVLPGWFSLAAIANGISSDAVTFYNPVWVDFNYFGFLQMGTYYFPYHAASQGISAVDAGGTINFKGPASSPDTMTISKAMTLRAVGGAVTIGR